MILYMVVCHDPYLPKEGFKEAAVAVCKTKEKAEEIAKFYDLKYGPYYHSVEPCEVVE